MKVKVLTFVASAAMLVAGCGGSGAAKDTSTTPDDKTTSAGDGDQSDDGVGKGDQTAYQDAQPDRDGGSSGPEEPGGGDDAGEPDGGGGSTGEPAVAAQTPDESQTGKFQTSESREVMSAFLIKPAQAAIKERDFPRAVALYSGVVAARGKGDAAALELARAYRLAFQFGAAMRVYDELAAATTVPSLRQEAQREANKLRNQSIPFQRQFRAKWAKKEAVEAFKKGRAAFKKKKYADALVYYRMAAALDETLNGPIREIGSAYEKLGAKEEGTRFYLDYLWRSPMGSFSDDVRKKLAKTKVLGYLNVSSKLPCDELWVEGQFLRKRKLPIKKLALAPGYYRWLCFNGRYAIEYFDEAKVEAGKTTDLEFKWAVIVNAMDNPWGRIVIENPRSGNMNDLGVEAKELGVLVAPDGRALKIQLKEPSGRVAEERYVRLQPGQKYVVKWKNQK